MSWRGGTLLKFMLTEEGVVSHVQRQAEVGSAACVVSFWSEIVFQHYVFRDRSEEPQNYVFGCRIRNNLIESKTSN